MIVQTLPFLCFFSPCDIFYVTAYYLNLKRGFEHMIIFISFLLSFPKHANLTVTHCVLMNLFSG